jgi:NADH dehydrogenase/NADH:ubiquinone oxidoreductase subunit G
MSVGVNAIGVSVDTGDQPQDLDFMAAVSEGGENFLARARAIFELKAQQEVAYAKLRIGDDAQAALDDAHRKQSAAGSKLDQAIRALAQAEQTVAEMVETAREQASVIIANAKNAASAEIAEATKARIDADSYAAIKKIDADAALKRASETEAAAVAALEKHMAAKTAADLAKVEAESLSEALRRRVATLRGEIAGIQ